MAGVLVLDTEVWLFPTWRLPCYVCVDAFVYHDKGTTLRDDGTGKRDVKKEDRGFK
jgi:hypothetical protein